MWFYHTVRISCFTQTIGETHYYHMCVRFNSAHTRADLFRDYRRVYIAFKLVGLFYLCKIIFLPILFLLVKCNMCDFFRESHLNGLSRQVVHREKERERENREERKCDLFNFESTWELNPLLWNVECST